MAHDKQYIENLAFKMTHELPHPAGVELLKEVEKNLSTRISQVLMEFKNKVEKATQVEKCLIFKKTIHGIKFSRDFLEVVVSINDTTYFETKNLLNGGPRRLSLNSREDAVNPDAPASNTSSIHQYGDPNGIRTRVITVKG